jgi:ATP citrate (pro-S)-lyase
MPRRKVREYQAKKLLSANITNYYPLRLRVAQVTPATDYTHLLDNNHWLENERLVVKPDMLFGKRGKNNLVLLDATFREAQQFITERINKPVTIDGLQGEVSHFIIEPFVPHKDEYYLSITATRDENQISFSDCGGMDIEENWDKVKKIGVPVDTPIDAVPLDNLFAENLGQDRILVISKFIRACYSVFVDLNFHFLELNPFTLTASGGFPLDMRGELDDCAIFKNTQKWKVDDDLLDFPSPFGKVYPPEEKFVHELDEKTGASLKLTVLNPHGRIWAMVAGGGASVIYADTVADLGYGSELGNYGEYSGDPSENETYQYALTLLTLATRHNDGRPKALIIGGAVANFTDVAATFSGIIHAIRERVDQLRQANIKVFVRRGGPNYQVGLQKMRDLSVETKIPFEVYGPDAHMTKIVKMAIEWINPSSHL